METNTQAASEILELKIVKEILGQDVSEDEKNSLETFAQEQNLGGGVFQFDAMLKPEELAEKTGVEFDYFQVLKYCQKQKIHPVQFLDGFSRFIAKKVSDLAA